jgi:uncharacterized integral membrane protein
MFRLISSITLLLFLVFFALFNRGPVEVVFFPKYLLFSGPIFLWIFFSFALGVMFSNIFYSGKFVKSFFRERKMRKKLAKFEKEKSETE